MIKASTLSVLVAALLTQNVVHAAPQTKVASVRAPAKMNAAQIQLQRQMTIQLLRNAMLLQSALLEPSAFNVGLKELVTLKYSASASYAAVYPFLVASFGGTGAMVVAEYVDPFIGMFSGVVVASSVVAAAGVSSLGNKMEFDSRKELLTREKIDKASGPIAEAYGRIFNLGELDTRILKGSLEIQLIERGRADVLSLMLDQQLVTAEEVRAFKSLVMPAGRQFKSYSTPLAVIPLATQLKNSQTLLEQMSTMASKKSGIVEAATLEISASAKLLRADKFLRSVK